ncbi:MAG: hypothetical protein JSR76_08090 [Verrucomicrobia bacterium]|nr:hypothetical protein [Verrucomicrobiota bacterium]
MELMEPVKFRFPSEEILTKYLFEKSFFNDPYYIEKGITDAVAKLAGRRFAGGERYKKGVLFGAQMMAKDILAGKDAFDEVKFTVYPLSDLDRADLAGQINHALLHCAVRVLPKRTL